MTNQQEQAVQNWLSSIFLEVPNPQEMTIPETGKRIGIPTWHTHQLRHTAAREIIRQHGLDSARAVLGHKTLQMTADYGGHDTDTASEVMLKIG